MLTFNKNYFAFAALLFVVEIVIGLFVHDNFVRPYVGDVLVVVLLYCALKAFLRLRVIAVALLVLAFSFTLEFLQAFRLVERLGLKSWRLARTVIGTSFSWFDLLAYAVGIMLVLGAEQYRKRWRDNGSFNRTS